MRPLFCQSIIYNIMLSNIAVCPLASFILVLIVIINILDIYLVGFQFVIIVTNVLISIFFVWLANKTCDRYHWVSWLITAYFVISIIGAVAMIFTPSAGPREGYESSKGTAKKNKREKGEGDGEGEGEGEGE